jgi:hypothetical protein
MKYDRPNSSSFLDTDFKETSTGDCRVGVSIWDTDGIAFKKTRFSKMLSYSILAGDARITVNDKCEITSSKFGIHLNNTNPITLGASQIGLFGAEFAKRNIFTNNSIGVDVVGMNADVDINSNNFKDYDFDITVRGPQKTNSRDNDFSANNGTQVDQIADNINTFECNRYFSTITGTHVLGNCKGLSFNNETYFSTKHDLLLQNKSATDFGLIAPVHGSAEFGRTNLFSSPNNANIQFSTNAPWNVTQSFDYFRDMGQAQYLPRCPLNLGTICTPTGLFKVASSTSDTPVLECKDAASSECQTEICWKELQIRKSISELILAAGKAPELLVAASIGGSDAISKLKLASPYLSIEIQMAIAESTNLSEETKLEVLEANAPIMQGVLSAMETSLSTSVYERLASISLQESAVSPRNQLEVDFIKLNYQEHNAIMAILSSLIENEQWDESETLLATDLSALGRQRLFGLMMHKNDYAKAHFYLNQTTDLVWKQLQSIQMKRVENSGLFALESEDESFLYQVAGGNSGHSSLAKAILIQLKEEIFLPEMPETAEERSYQNEHEQPLGTGLVGFDVYPNPAHSEIDIRIDTHIFSQLKTLRLVHLVSGRETIIEPISTLLNKSVADFPTGMYMIQLKLLTGDQLASTLAIIR